MLLPREHSTICDRPGSEGVDHHLAYITEPEMDTLLENDGWGKTKPGMFGTQGVKCFPRTLHVNEDGSRLLKAPAQLSEEEINKLIADRQAKLFSDARTDRRDNEILK